jgi:putative resolvase
MKIKEVKQLLKVTNRTVHNYITQGKIRFTKINEKHYIYNDEDVFNLINIKYPNRINVTYARVSSSKQINDLITQNYLLYKYCISNGFKLGKQYQDIKSGINFTNRKNFNILLSQIIENKIDNIIVENKDRICSFGFDLFEIFCKEFNTNIIVISDVKNKIYDNELIDDLKNIIQHFLFKSNLTKKEINNIIEKLLVD